MRLPFYILIIFVFSVSNSYGGDALTLQGAINLALANNPNLNISRQKVVAADGQRIDIGKWPNPKFQVTIDEAPFNSGISQSQTLAGFQQELPFPGKKKLDRRIGRAGVDLWNQNLFTARAILIREVKITFYEVLAAESRYDIAKEIVSLTNNSLKAVAKRRDAGRGLIQDQLRVEIEKERASADLADIDQQRETARQKLAALLGNAGLARYSLNGKLSDFRKPDLISQDGQKKGAAGISSHPKIAAARITINEAELSLKRERLERVPNLTAGVETGRDRKDGVDIFGLRFSLPLPLFNRRKGNIKKAGAELEIAKSELVATELALTTRMRAAYQQALSASQQVATYRERILPKADKAVRLANSGFSEGRYTLTDLLDSQRTTASVRLIYQDKLLDLLRAQAEIEALTSQSGNSN